MEIRGTNQGESKMKRSITLAIIFSIMISQILLSVIQAGATINSDERAEFVDISGSANFKSVKQDLPSNTLFSGTELWVDDDYNSTSAGGHTWGVNAFDRIQAAIYASDLNNTTTINILSGDYYERL